MAGLPPSLVLPAMRAAGSWMFSPSASWPQSRRRVELGFSLPPPPRNARIDPLSLGGVPCLEVVPPAVDTSLTIIYLHGGGYVVGSARTHRRLAALIAAAAGAR